MPGDRPRPGVRAYRASPSRPSATAPNFWPRRGCIEGRKVSAYPACRPEVELAGGVYADIPIDGAVTDGNLVTAPAWPAHPTWLAQFLAVLGTEIRL